MICIVQRREPLAPGDARSSLHFHRLAPQGVEMLAQERLITHRVVTGEACNATKLERIRASRLGTFLDTGDEEKLQTHCTSRIEFATDLGCRSRDLTVLDSLSCVRRVVNCIQQ